MIKVLKIIIWPIFLVVLCYAMSGLMPFHDDWCYATAPNPDFTLCQLLPTGAFWRPFDVLWGALMGLYPRWFPNANRICIAIGHTINSLLVYCVLVRISRGQWCAAVGTLFFSCSSAVAATLINADAINQTYSFCFGILAVLASLQTKWRKSYCIIAVYALVFVSILFKESGASWMAVIPAIGYYCDREWKRFLKEVGVGVVVLSGYFILRFALHGEVVLGDGQYYTLGFEPNCAFWSFLIETVMPLTAADGLAFACEKWMLILLSILLPVVFWWIWIGTADKKGIAEKSCLFGFVAVALAAPHCFFLGHHPAEMHFYPVVFAGALFIALLSGDEEFRFARIGAIAALATLFAAGWWDKMSETYMHSQRTQALFMKLSNARIDFSKPVYFILEQDRDICCYSTFTQNAAHGVYFGKACRALNGWRDFDWHMAYTPAMIARIPFNAQVIRIR